MSSHKGRILVLDDEAYIRELLQDVLRRLGYDPVVAEDGARAVELYREAFESGKPFDVVILDLGISRGMGGLEAFHKIWAIDPEVKALASSGNTNAPAILDFQKHGFRGVVTKPCRIADLNQQLSEVIHPGVRPENPSA